MGKTTKIFAWLSGIFFIAGVILKVNHLYGANILVMLGTLSYSAFYLPLWLAEKWKESSFRFFYVAQFIVLIAIINSALFKFMHWTGSSILFYTSICVFTFLFIPAWIYKNNKDKKSSVQSIHTTVLLIFLAGYFFLQISYQVSQQLLYSYIRSGIQLEKTYSRLQIKSDKLYESFELLDDKANPLYERAMQLRNLTDSTEHFITRLKSLLISKADGITMQAADSVVMEKVRNQFNYDIPSMIMISNNPEANNGLNGQSLRHAIDLFRDSSIALIISANKAIIAEGINLSTDDIPDEQGVNQGWIEANFQVVPLNSALSTLLSLQCEIKNAENQILTDLLNSISLNDKSNLAAQVAEMGIKYESEKKEQQIALMKKDKELLDARMTASEKDIEGFRKIIVYYTLGIVAFLILLFYVFRSNVQRRKLNMELAAKNRQLDESYSELKSTQALLVQSEKMSSLGQLTAGVAHEINNPINFVSANVNPLKRNLNELIEALKRNDGAINEDLNFTIDETRQLLKGIEEGSKRTAEIVKGLRNFSRLDEEDMKKAGINEGIESTLVLLRNKLDQQNIEVIKSPGEIPEIECYPGQLNQVFMNLLTNAIDATGSGGNIFITTSYENDHVKVSIRDTGHGMSNEVKKKLFDPFFTTKEVGKGTGLGLSISYGIVEKHDGKIEVKSEVGHGTEFIITLPVQEKKPGKEK